MNRLPTIMLHEASFSHNTQRKTEPPKFPRLTMALPDATFSAVRFCSCTVRRTIDLLGDSLRFLFIIVHCRYFIRWADDK